MHNHGSVFHGTGPLQPAERGRRGNAFEGEAEITSLVSRTTALLRETYSEVALQNSVEVIQRACIAVMEDIAYQKEVIAFYTRHFTSFDKKQVMPVLAAHFLSRTGNAAVEISAESREMLSTHPWPGNVRELRSVMERAALAASGETIRPRDLSFD